MSQPDSPVASPEGATPSSAIMQMSESSYERAIDMAREQGAAAERQRLAAMTEPEIGSLLVLWADAYGQGWPQMVRHKNEILAAFSAQADRVRQLTEALQEAERKLAEPRFMSGEHALEHFVPGYRRPKKDPSPYDAGADRGQRG